MPAESRARGEVTEFKSDASVATSRIEKLSEAIATAEKDLQNATTLREGEAKIFKASEAELMDTVDALSRAIGVLEKEARRGERGVSFRGRGARRGPAQGNGRGCGGGKARPQRVANPPCTSPPAQPAHLGPHGRMIIFLRSKSNTCKK